VRAIGARACRDQPVYVVPGAVHRLLGGVLAAVHQPARLHSRYINSSAAVETILVTDGLTVICLTLVVNYLTRKIPAFQAVILGTVVTSLSWVILALRPTVWGAVLSLFVLALGEIIQAPRITSTSHALRLRRAGHLHGLCFSAHRNWIADRWLVWRHAGPPLRRSHASTGAHLWTVTAVGLATRRCCGFMTNCGDGTSAAS